MKKSEDVLTQAALTDTELTEQKELKSIWGFCVGSRVSQRQTAKWLRRHFGEVKWSWRLILTSSVNKCPFLNYQVCTHSPSSASASCTPPTESWTGMIWHQTDTLCTESKTRGAEPASSVLPFSPRLGHPNITNTLTDAEWCLTWSRWNLVYLSAQTFPSHCLLLRRISCHPSSELCKFNKPVN